MQLFNINYLFSVSGLKVIFQSKRNDNGHVVFLFSSIFCYSEFSTAFILKGEEVHRILLFYFEEDEIHLPPLKHDDILILLHKKLRNS